MYALHRGFVQFILNNFKKNSPMRSGRWGSKLHYLFSEGKFCRERERERQRERERENIFSQKGSVSLEQQKDCLQAGCVFPTGFWTGLVCQTLEGPPPPGPGLGGPGQPFVALRAGPGTKKIILMMRYNRFGRTNYISGPDDSV